MGLDLDDMVDRLMQVRGVVAVTLGGSRATGDHRPDSDWDIGVYYEGGLDTDAIRGWGWSGRVFEPGEWAEFMHGGAWLRHGGQRVDLIYRDISVVDQWLDRAEQGRFELARVPGYLAGMPSYTLAAEMALGRPLAGTVPSPEYPERLAADAPDRWRWEADFALDHAERHRGRGDDVLVRGLVALALVQTAHGRCAATRTWVRNEKGLLARAGLEPAGRRFDLIAEQHGLAAALGWLRDER